MDILIPSLETTSWIFWWKYLTAFSSNICNNSNSQGDNSTIFPALNTNLVAGSKLISPIVIVVVTLVDDMVHLGIALIQANSSSPL
jgi:hypothetical protein